MDSKWIWIGLGGLALLWVLSRGRGGAQTLVTGDPSRVDSDRERFAFAGQGLSVLGSVLAAQEQADAQETQARYGFMAQEAQAFADIERSKAMLSVAVSQAEAQKEAARQAARGRSGFKLSIPLLGDFGINW